MSETLLDDANPEARQPFFATSIFLGSLVAVLTICTAVAAFQASRLAVDAGTAGGQSVRALLESNAAFLGADQVTSSDFTLFGLSLEAENADAQQFYETGFSPALREALDRNGDDVGTFPFDEQYYDEQFAVADEVYQDVFASVEAAGDKRAQSERFQLATFIFAIGLAFSSWASLAEGTHKMRLMFSLFAAGSAGVGVIVFGLAVLSLT